MKMLWIATCDDCTRCESVGLMKRCSHHGFNGSGRSREIKAGVIPRGCPFPAADALGMQLVSAMGRILELEEALRMAKD